MIRFQPPPARGRDSELDMQTLAKTGAARVAALDRYAILDTEPEQSFDDLVTLASYVCQTPMAFLSLVDDHRQWFKSKVGVEVRETPLESSICVHAIHDGKEDLFVVPDTLEDPRFRENPLVVREPRIRFYAGAPLIDDDGFALGTLCVVDRRPRELNHEQTEALKSLRRLAVGQMELRRNLVMLKGALNDRTKEEHAREQELQRVQEKLVRVMGLKL